jgi:VWFA-related protein
LFGLNSAGLRQLHPFTTDTKVLVLALQKLKLSLRSEESTQPDSTLTDDPAIDGEATYEEQLLSDVLQELNDTAAADYQRMATCQTLSAMAQFAHALGTIPGRKTLIWATAGFPFTLDDPNSFARQGDDLRPQYEEAWRSLNSANIAVYPVGLGSVDYTPKGLPSANATVSKTQINTIRGTNGSLRSPVNLRYDQGVQQRLTMRAFADATGGRACVTISELEKCFAQAVDDSRAYYLLGYYLGDDTQPGWRRLKVKVVAGDGLHIRSRTGFYVGPKVPVTSEQSRQELVDALASVCNTRVCV